MKKHEERLKVSEVYVGEGGGFTCTQRESESMGMHYCIWYEVKGNAESKN